MSDSPQLIQAVTAVGRAITGLGEQQHQIVAATVLAVPATSTTNQMIYIAYDVAPTTPIEAHVLNGWIPPVGARVLCLVYPPRGVVVLGQSDDAQLVAGSGVGYGYLQSALNGLPGGTLYLNNNGGSVASFLMRARYAHDTSGSQFTSTNTAFVPIGTTNADVTIPITASGAITVTLGGDLQVSIATAFSIASFEIRDANVTGTVLFSPSDNFSVSFNGAINQRAPMAGTFLISGLAPASGILYIRPALRTTAGTASWGRPAIHVRPEF